MLGGQIGKDARRKADGIEFSERQCVGGNLHQHIFHAVVNHFPQHPVEVGRVGRGHIRKRVAVLRRQMPPAGFAPHRADQSRAVHGGFQYRAEHMRDGGFAVCSRHADELQTCNGIAPERVVKPCGGAPRVVGINSRNLRGFTSRFAQNRDRAFCDRLPDVSMPIGMQTADTDEKTSLRHTSRIHCNCGNFRFGVAPGTFQRRRLAEFFQFQGFLRHNRTSVF